MNAIVNKLIEKRNGHYCHVLEVSDVYELKSILEQIVNEFSDEFSDEEIQEFIDTLTVYCLDETQESEVYNYQFKI
jgi:hypothetical protein